jgi:hypothetical protein
VISNEERVVRRKAIEQSLADCYRAIGIVMVRRWSPVRSLKRDDRMR